jgi:hypothetical protein
MVGWAAGGWSVLWILHDTVEWARQLVLQRLVLQRALPWRPQVGQMVCRALAAGMGNGGGCGREAAGGWFAAGVGVSPRSQNLNLWPCGGLEHWIKRFSTRRGGEEEKSLFVFAIEAFFGGG